MNLPGKGVRYSAILVTVLACMPAGRVPANSPVIRSDSTRQLPSSSAITAPARTWTFRYTPGTMEYEISRSAEIQTQPDSASEHQVSTNRTHETIVLDTTTQGFSILATIDTFSVTTQGLIGPVEHVEVPVSVKATFTTDTFAIPMQNTVGECSPVTSTLVSDLNNLITRFPPQLLQGFRWSDSLEVSGCYATVQTIAHLVRTFVVIGQSSYAGIPVVLVERTDTIHAQGEGVQLQHRITLEAAGSGHSQYFLSQDAGRVIHLSTDQLVKLSVSASKRLYKFTEDSHQEFRLVR
jgi:hypothetical protein